jgi:hypothetical protein
MKAGKSCVNAPVVKLKSSEPKYQDRISLIICVFKNGPKEIETETGNPLSLRPLWPLCPRQCDNPASHPFQPLSVHQ